MTSNIFRIFENLKNIKYDSHVLPNLDQLNDELNENNILTCIHVNIKSLRAHWDYVMIRLEKLLDIVDVLVFTEVDVKEEEALSYQINNFEQIVKTRMAKSKNNKLKSGGGIIMYFSDTFVTDRIEYNFQEAESLNVKLKHVKRKTEYTILSIYRPPDRNRDLFLEDLHWWLTNATKKTDTIIMLGDINICTLKNTSQNSRYINTLYNQQLIPTIRNITREAMKEELLTQSCLDHFNVRLKYNYELSSYVIQERPSDHYYIALQLYHDSNNVNKARTGPGRKATVINQKEVDKEMSTTRWNDFLDCTDPTELYDAFVNKFQNIYEKCTIEISVSKKKDLNPWVTGDVRKLIQEKNYLLKKMAK